jgi:hypothetical protein
MVSLKLDYQSLHGLPSMFSARTGTRHNILVMGRACFLRAPESEANDLNFLLCRCNETSYASRLGNNEI